MLRTVLDNFHINDVLIFFLFLYLTLLLFAVLDSIDWICILSFFDFSIIKSKVDFIPDVFPWCAQFSFSKVGMTTIDTMAIVCMTACSYKGVWHHEVGYHDCNCECIYVWAKAFCNGLYNIFIEQRSKIILSKMFCR